MAICLTDVDSLAAGTRKLVNKAGSDVRWDSVLESKKISQSRRRTIDESDFNIRQMFI